jgi:plastocyanin
MGRRLKLFKVSGAVAIGFGMLSIFLFHSELENARANTPAATITFTCCAYTPSEVTIRAGETVSWSGTFSSHPLVSDDALWPTPTTGGTFDFTFNTPGNYRFHCQIHGGPNGLGMSGQVHVQAVTFLPVILKDAP